MKNGYKLAAGVDGQRAQAEADRERGRQREPEDVQRPSEEVVSLSFWTSKQ